MPLEDSAKIDAESSTRVPRSARRIIGLLEALADEADGCRLEDLGKALDSPNTSLARLLPPFLSEDYLTLSHGRYRLGPMMYRLAVAMLNSRQFHRTIRRFLEELVRRTSESAYVAVIDTEMRVATFIDMISSQHSVRHAVRLGFVRPLYATAGGRVLLAHQNPDWIDTYLREVEIKPLTSRPAPSLERFRLALEEIRNDGVAVVLDESTEGGGAVAAPVLAPDGSVEAAFIVAGPTERLTPKISAIKQSVIEVAALASGSRPA